MPSIERPATGKAFWRSLDDLADAPEFQKFVRNEFPAMADEMLAPTSRRNFLRFMGASLALAGMTSCRWPVEEIVPFAHRPEGYDPGLPRFYATAMEQDGAATGLLVKSYDGRPIKIEGNPEHPYSLGSTSAQAQAALLELYDPDRSRRVVQLDKGQEFPRTWDEFRAFATARFAELARQEGRGLRFLCGATASPSIAAQRERLQRDLPRARWHEYEPHSRDAAREGSRMVFGAPHRTHLALDRAELIVTLDEDLLLDHPAAVRHSRDWAAGRTAENGRISRMWAVESCYSLTGAMADRRVPLAARSIPVAAVAIAAELVLERGLALPPGLEGAREALARFEAHPLRGAPDWKAIADDLLAHRGRGLLAAGPRQPAEVHALVHVLNAALGNVGRTVRYTAEPDPGRPSHLEAIRELADDMGRGLVKALVVLDGNPVFDAPADLDFAAKLERVATKIHLGPYRDETARACDWHVPRAHFLESWGDTRAYDGTVSIVQPLIEPLFGGRTIAEMLSLVVDETPGSAYDITRRTFDRLRAPGAGTASAAAPAGSAAGAGDLDPAGAGGPAGASAGGMSVADERAWRRALHDGLLPQTAWPEAQPQLRDAGWGEAVARRARAAQQLPEGETELVFLRDSRLHGGRFANNGWLQELPEPLTKLTWDNALLLGPATARALGLRQEAVARVDSGERSLELPVFILPGQPEGTAGVWTGFGRRAGGRVADGVGVDVFALRTSDAMHRVPVRLSPTGGSYRLATTQEHWAMDAQGARETEKRANFLAREVDIREFLHDPHVVQELGPEYVPQRLWKEFEYTGHKWGMTIDLTACTGCNACITACQAENNIPVVGKDEVARGREMHWIRVDRYFSGPPEAPSVAVQPVTCHHCENAPCEQVCPVAATVHDSEGLNVMVYNRCVGTRYCLNNCPYKVRRFNWFNNHKHDTDLQKMMYNPGVTVRSRGVMEKCTYCLQRINAVKVQARNEQRPVRDGEITPACAQACPTRAIVFGDLNDPDSRVRRLQQDPRAYSMLEEMHVKPRTRYLARLRNRGADDGHSGEGAA